MTSSETSGQVLVPVRIAGTGSYVPEKILTNHDLEKMVDTSDDWIISRTGIIKKVDRLEEIPTYPINLGDDLHNELLEFCCFDRYQICCEI